MYKTGSYIVFSKKEHICKKCEQAISSKIYYFGRCLQDNLHYNSWTRWHLECALELEDLNDYEKNIIGQKLNTNISEAILNRKVNGYLRHHENKNNLTFIKVFVGKITLPNRDVMQVGRKGFSDYIIFLPNAKTIFIELKTEKTYLNENQKEFQNRINNLAFEYHIIRSVKELDDLLLIKTGGQIC
jgi:hypothetical protein